MCRMLSTPANEQTALALLTLLFTLYSQLCTCDPCVQVLQQPADLAVLNLDCSSSWELGAAIGIATRSMIQQRYAASKGLHRCMQYAGTPAGQRAVDDMLQLHSELFPSYMNELSGLAAGADVPFQQVLMANMRQELSLAMAHDPQHEDSCTDVLLSAPSQQPNAAAKNLKLSGGRKQPRVTVLGHNEDMTRDTEGRTYFVRFTNTTADNKSNRQHMNLFDSNKQQQQWWREQHFTWLAFVYAGELASSGFGFNSAGIGFTLNAVFPTAAAMPGVSRNFISRQLLEARSIQEALDTIGRSGQAVGHSYNLFDINSKRMLNVEVGPGSVMSVLEVTPSQPGPATASWYFHANMYKHLVLQQRTDNSSYHREARALQLQAPRTAADVLAILGDVADPDYPIYRTGASAADADVITLCTALVDLEEAVLEVYTGNPAHQSSKKLQLKVDLQSLQLLPLASTS